MKQSADFSLMGKILLGFFVFGLIFNGCSFEKKPVSSPPPSAETAPAPADKGTPGTVGPGGTTTGVPTNTTTPERDSGF